MTIVVAGDDSQQGYAGNGCGIFGDESQIGPQYSVPCTWLGASNPWSSVDLGPLYAFPPIIKAFIIIRKHGTTAGDERRNTEHYCATTARHRFDRVQAAPNTID